MGAKLVEIVDYVRKHSRGAPAVNLARLNLLVGRAVSRSANTMPDEPELLDKAWSSAREIVGSLHEGGPK